MRKYLSYVVCMSVGVLATVMPAGAAQSLNECHRVASECLNAGGDRQQCQTRVDDCMSRNACEEVYLSCLELMEIDETVTEAACAGKRATCRRKRGETP